MKKRFNNRFTLKLLQLICAGKGVDINISTLSEKFSKHRNTIKDRVNQIIDHGIIEKPNYPFLWMLNEYPLLVVSKDKFYRDETTKQFIEKDPHIFAAYYFQEEFFNTLTIQFHKDLYSYQSWSDFILEEGRIIKEEDRHPPDASLFSTRRILKYDPSTPLRVIEREFKKGNIKEICGFQPDSLCLDILKMVIGGKAIRTNENYLARTLGVNRNTVARQIQALLSEGIIGKPCASFPRLIVPPDFVLVFSFLEIKRRCSEVESFIRRDSHVPLLIKANKGRYNYFVATTFKSIEDHLIWQEKYTQNFISCIEAIKNTYLSPAMAFSINSNYVSLQLINQLIDKLKDTELEIDYQNSSEESLASLLSTTKEENIL